MAPISSNEDQVLQGESRTWRGTISLNTALIDFSAILDAISRALRATAGDEDR
jgi:hypothetical protein